MAKLPLILLLGSWKSLSLSTFQGICLPPCYHYPLSSLSPHLSLQKDDERRGWGSP